MAQATAFDGNVYFNPDRPGRIVEIADTAANDSDKTLTVPAGSWWQILSVYAELAASADAGNRQMELHVRDDSANVLGRFPAAAVQIADATEFYHWSVSGDPAETVATFHNMPLAPTILPTGFDLRIFDSAAIAATADDLTVRAVVIVFEDN